MSTTAGLKWNKATLFQRTRKLLRSLGDIAGDNFLKQDLARFTKELVYKRVKSGKGVTSDRTPFQVTQHRRLLPLSKNYKRYRRTGFVTFIAKKKNGKKVTVNFNVGRPALGEFGRPDKSNLTLSGQMLASMTFDIKRFGFVVLIPETRRRGESITNAQLARYVSRAGRPFMNLTAGENRIVKSRMKKTIQKRLKGLLR